MKNFTLYKDRVTITKNNAAATTIDFNKDSGKVFYRLKIDTLWDTKHPGIYIGHDLYNNHYFMHNHYEAGKPTVVTLPEFSMEQNWYPYDTPVTHHWHDIIKIGLNEVLRGESYHSTNYNCQTFVNRACNNTSRSEDLDKWIGRGLVGAFVFLGVRALINRNN